MMANNADALSYLNCLVALDNWISIRLQLEDCKDLSDWFLQREPCLPNNAEGKWYIFDRYLDNTVLKLDVSTFTIIAWYIQLLLLISYANHLILLLYSTMETIFYE